jgi:signal transduction histidine kinase
MIVEPSLPSERNEYLRTFLTGIAGFALLLQLRFTAESTRVTTATLALTEQSHVTDRFYKAIEQLGHESSDVRMGALYALERISRDSDRDFHQVMSIIAAYIRQRASNRARPLVQLPLEREEHVVRLSEDIQCALKIIGRRKRTFPDDAEDDLDLRDTNLRGAVLTDAQFSSVDFTRCDLRNSTFINCSFRYARFVSVDARHTLFSTARLARANFTNANLTDVEFDGDFKSRTEISGEVDSELLEETLDRANFTGANLTRTLFKVEDMTTCRGLTRDQLKHATLSENTNLPSDNLYDWS